MGIHDDVAADALRSFAHNCQADVPILVLAWLESATVVADPEEDVFGGLVEIEGIGELVAKFERFGRVADADLDFALAGADGLFGIEDEVFEEADELIAVGADGPDVLLDFEFIVEAVFPINLPILNLYLKSKIASLWEID